MLLLMVMLVMLMVLMMMMIMMLVMMMILMMLVMMLVRMIMMLLMMMMLIRMMMLVMMIMMMMMMIHCRCYVVVYGRMHSRAVCIWQSVEWTNNLKGHLAEIACKQVSNSMASPVDSTFHNWDITYAPVTLCRICRWTCMNVKSLKFAPIPVRESTNHVNVSFELGSFSIIVR